MRPRNILIVLLAIDLLLLVAHVSGWFIRGEAYLLFDMDHEMNIPTWWSSTKFVAAGILVGMPAVADRFRRCASSYLLAALFLALSLDDAVSLHERVGDFLAVHLLAGMTMANKGGFLWPVFLGLPVISAVGLAVWRLAGENYFSVNVWKRYVVALSVFFITAVGSDIIEFQPLWEVLYHPPLYNLMASVEETLEHIGASLLVWASLTALVERRREVADWLNTQHQ